MYREPHMLENGITDSIARVLVAAVGVVLPPTWRRQGVHQFALRAVLGIL